VVQKNFFAWSRKIFGEPIHRSFFFEEFALTRSGKTHQKNP